MDTFEELFEETLRDIYDAERSHPEAQPRRRWPRKASSEDSAAAFTTHDARRPSSRWACWQERSDGMN